jgi:acetyl-CoA acyltransferase
MKPNRRVFVVGGANTTYLGKGHPDFVWKKHPDFGTRENPTIEEHMSTAIKATLANTGVSAADVQRGFVANFAGQTFVNQGHLGAMAPRVDPGLAGKPWVRLEAACASGGTAVVAAAESLQAGYDVAMVVGAEVQTTVSPREGGDFLARAAHYPLERGLDDFTFPAMFARRWKHYQEAFGATEEQLAHVTVKAYNNANKNPKAHMTAAKRTLEWAAGTEGNPQFLRNEELRDYMKVSHCSQVSDGASGMILATEDGLAKLGKTPADCVELRSWGFQASPLAMVSDYTELTNTRGAADEALADSGITRDQIGVVELHDCFAVNEWLMLEALGFAERGRARELTLSGATNIDGRLPVNTGGGLIGFGHPVGATGVKQLFEIFRQMKGQCGDYQVPNAPAFGITANMGGDDRTTVVTVLANVG